jgi:hypothetical protein
MLPGFRFLFAATMLSMSLLIFGLGAAALFRAAHESFASTSSWHATPDVPFAQRPDTLPMLAALRVEAVTAKLADPPKVEAAPAGPTEAITGLMTGDQVAALPPEETAPAEIARPVEASAPVAENPPVPEAAPVASNGTEAAIAGGTKTAATANETKTAAVAAFDSASLKSEPAMTQPEPAAPPTTNSTTVTPAASAAPFPPAVPTTAPEADNAMARIATLGGPPVEISESESVLETQMVKIPRARPDESAIKKHQQARRALRRRRLAARARFLAQQQLQANPFAQPPFAQQPFAQQPFAPPQQSFAAAARRQ